jgi:hypothetical protein
MFAYTEVRDWAGKAGSHKQEVIHSLSVQCEENLSEYEFGIDSVYSGPSMGPHTPVTNCPWTKPTSRRAIAMYKTLIEDQERDRAYFAAHFRELQQRFRNKYVAIRDQVVIDADEDLLQLLRRIRSGGDVEKRYYIQKVNDLFWAGEGVDGIVVF